jgi:2-hydroxychromene-2-carboxylate isomerase
MPATPSNPSPSRPVWYFDFISPFAYLQFEWLRRERPGLDVEPRPVMLAALLKHWGSIGPAELPTKRVFTYRFVTWKARQLGIPMRFPPTHPFNPLPALRLAIAAGGGMDAIAAIFRHVWRDGLDGTSVEALRSLAASLGITDPVTAIADPEVKASLAANGQSALADGVFGVPTFIVDRQLFWGLDATDMLVDYLAVPERFEDEAMRSVAMLPIGIERAR